MRGVFSQPNFLQAVSRSLFHIFSHPIQFAERARDQFLFTSVMLIAPPNLPPEKLGEIKGELAINLIAAIATTETVGIGAAEFRLISAEIVEAQAASEVGAYQIQEY